MKIIKHNWNWSRTPPARSVSVRYLVPHHSAGYSSAEQMHEYHKNVLGWSGLGYTYVIDQDGDIHEGRKEWMANAAVAGHNSDALSYCFIGNYDTQKTMPKAQLEAGRELTAYLTKKYPGAGMRRHKDFNATACPGRYFPFTAIQQKPSAVANPTPKPTLVSKAKQSELAQLMLTYALKSQTGPDPVPLNGWEGLNILNPYWGRGKQLLAVRVSSRVLGPQKKSPKPTVALWDALRSKLAAKE